MSLSTYAIALGSNRRHGTHGGPADILRAGVAALEAEGVRLVRLSPIVATPALGPAGRDFANAAAVVEGPEAPVAMLTLLKRVERAFGRRGGRAWGPRVIDLDILLWGGGFWESPGLIIPHPEMRRRGFVLGPLADIMPEWRDPVTGLSVAQLLARLQARRPVDRGRRAT